MKKESNKRPDVYLGIFYFHLQLLYLTSWLLWKKVFIENNSWTNQRERQLPQMTITSVLYSWALYGMTSILRRITKLIQDSRTARHRWPGVLWPLPHLLPHLVPLISLFSHAPAALTYCLFLKQLVPPLACPFLRFPHCWLLTQRSPSQRLSAAVYLKQSSSLREPITLFNLFHNSYFYLKVSY